MTRRVLGLRSRRVGIGTRLFFGIVTSRRTSSACSRRVADKNARTRSGRARVKGNRRDSEVNDLVFVGSHGKRVMSDGIEKAEEVWSGGWQRVKLKREEERLVEVGVEAEKPLLK